MTETAEMIDPMTGEIVDQKKLAEALLEQAREQGVSLLGPGGLPAGLTKNVLETASGLLRVVRVGGILGFHFTVRVPFMLPWKMQW
jgi:hypothetical protein